ncbi:MAG: S8 family peptidase, partial [Clostridia bacterium]
AYIDTGIKRHLDFVVPNNRIVYFKDFISNQKEPYDDNGHGTFVAGVGSGNGMCSGGKFSGIAPSSNIISLKALGESGDSSAATILEAMQWVFDNHKNFNIKVVCMSFGSEPLESGDPIMKGAEKLWDKGIIVVAAAGNSGSELRTIKSPGISPKIITVGGFDDKRDENDKYDRKKFEIAEFSSRGPALGKIKPDLIAPSVGISSCSAGEGHYVRLNGTSVATPMIAGLCALFLQVYPFATPNFVKRKLLACCSPLTFNKFFEGSGIPNAKSFFNIR